MKTFLVIILFIIATRLLAQVYIDFEQDSLAGWMQYPESRWTIETTDAIQGTYSLHHIYDNASSSIDYISYHHQLLELDSVNTRWSFWVRHGYPPSSLNNWRIYFLSNKSAESIAQSDNDLEAYMIGVNVNATDDLLKFYRVKDGDMEVLLNTGFNLQTHIHPDSAFQLIIHRTPQGLWEFSMDTCEFSSPAFELGSITENQIHAGSYLSLAYAYSSGQDQKLWLDDLHIDGYFVQDTIAPLIEDIYIPNTNKIELLFSEPIDTKTIDLADFHLYDNSITPLQYSLQNGNTILLSFSDDLENEKEYKVHINGISDLYGNELNAYAYTFWFYIPEIYTVVISEIMADPYPEVLLPNAEFVELYNTSSYPINLKNWSLKINENQVFLPDYTLQPLGYAVLTDDENVNLFDHALPVIGIENMLAITNTSGTIILKNQLGQQQHYLEYSSNMYGESFKEEGGWSLEMVDANNPCNYAENYVASKSVSGGTPGEDNTVKASNADIISPWLDRSAYRNDTTVVLIFNERMDSISIASTDFYYFSGYNNFFKQINTVAEDFASIELILNEVPETNTVFSIKIQSDITDCAKNPINKDHTVDYGIPVPADSFDIIITEIMFNPEEDGVEYAELYNRSNKIVDLNFYTFNTLETYTYEIKHTACIYKSGYLVFPGDYIILTGDKDKFYKKYFDRENFNVVEIEDMPVLTNEEGVISITNNEGDILDLLVYGAGNHFDLLQSSKGVSLERTCMECITNDPGSWHSASSTSGFATPGEENSQLFEQQEKPGEICLEPETFSPDNDGFEDYVTINYQLEIPGCSASITIFDASGRLVKKLVNNATLDAEGFIIWDGTNTSGQRVSMGVYVVMIEILNINGKKKAYKESCVVAPMRR